MSDRGKKMRLSEAVILCQAPLIMVDYVKEKAEKAKVFKKLMGKWLNRQDTARKASLLLDRNPEIKIARTLKDQNNLS